MPPVARQGTPALGRSAEQQLGGPRTTHCNLAGLLATQRHTPLVGLQPPVPASGHQLVRPSSTLPPSSKSVLLLSLALDCGAEWKCGAEGEGARLHCVVCSRVVHDGPYVEQQHICGFGLCVTTFLERTQPSHLHTNTHMQTEIMDAAFLVCAYDFSDPSIIKGSCIEVLAFCVELC